MPPFFGSEALTSKVANILPAPPYKDPLDNKIFEILKKEKVSFVDYEHEDLKCPVKLLFNPHT